MNWLSYLRVICSNDWKPYMLFESPNYWEFQLFCVHTLWQQIPLRSCKAIKAENAQGSRTTLSSESLPPSQIMIWTSNTHSSKNLEKVCSNSTCHSQCVTCILTVCRGFFPYANSTVKFQQVSTPDKKKLMSYLYLIWVLTCTSAALIPKIENLILKWRNYN